MGKKSTVILISIAVVAAFIGMLYYGVRHRHGYPTVAEETRMTVLKVPFVESDIELAEGISKDLWSSISAEEIKLMYQVMVLPWPKRLVPPIGVKTFHNQRFIYFYITWRDDTENRNHQANIFSDATAVLFPMDDDTQPSTLLMGFLGKANIWQWKAVQDEEYWSKRMDDSAAYADFYYPFEKDEMLVVSKDEPKSAANDLVAIRVGTITPKELQNVEARGVWKDGAWHVVFRRSFEPVDLELDAIFKPGKKRLCAFAVWNGENGDRGGRKSISDWVELEIE